MKSLFGAALALITVLALHASSALARPDPRPFAGLTARTVAGTKNSYGITVRGPQTISHIWIDGAYRAIGADKPISDLKISAFKATNVTRDGISVCDAHNVDIGIFDMRHSSVPSAGKDMPAGIGLGRKGCGTAGAHIRIHDGAIHGFQMAAVDGTYHNGDGIDVEAGYSDVRITNVRIEDSSDGCVDAKATGLYLDQVTGIRCNRTFRIWGPDAQAGIITAQDFSGAGVWLANNASIHIGRFIGRGGHAGSIVFRWDGGATLIVDSCDLTGMAPGAILTKADGAAKQVQLGKGCQLSAPSM